MKSLDLATPPEILDDRLERKIRFGFTEFECGQILGVLAQRCLDGVVDEVGHGSVGLGRLQTQGSVDLGIEVDRGPLGPVFHVDTIRLDVVGAFS